MEIIETSNGKLRAIYDGYIYRKYRVSKDGRVSWVCLQEKSHKCKGRLITQDNTIFRGTEHQCKRDLDPATVRRKSAHRVHKVKKKKKKTSDEEEYISVSNMDPEDVRK